MAQPPVDPVITRELVRVIPFATQKSFVNAALAAGGTFVWEFDVGLAVTDPNQFLALPSVASAPTNSTVPPQIAVGPWLDVVAYSFATAGSITVEYAADVTCAYRTLTPQAVAANTLTNISGLRITGRFCRVTYTNTGVAVSLCELGIYVRSN